MNIPSGSPPDPAKRGYPSKSCYWAFQRVYDSANRGLGVSIVQVFLSAGLPNQVNHSSEYSGIASINSADDDSASSEGIPNAGRLPSCGYNMLNDLNNSRHFA